MGDLTENPGDGKTVQDTTKGEGSRVAVVDTGVYDGHPDLADVVNAELSENFTTDQYDFRPNGAGDHGTHVAGTIAGTNADGEGILGTAPETEIVAHRVFSGVPGEGASTGDTVAALAAAATKGCDAANFSVGYPPANPETDEWVSGVKMAYRRLAEYARSQDMLIVNSAGNAGIDMTPDDVISLPTEVEGIFGVSATGPIGYLWDDKQASREDKALVKLEDGTDSPAFYTNYGEGTDVSAAGGDADLEAAANDVPGWYYDLVFSTVVEQTENGPVAGYGWKAGTSMAAPQVTGAVALVRSLRPDASVEEVEAMIQETARDAPGGELYHGAGHLDLRRLVKRAR
ncbi:S8 family peptidase [Halorussus caseinilyticus]|uniref:S8 family serine peptidase n=1 Tax=Halorussus caseinilyticus TaxID=3034025 RepID=A0ABD5WHS4_9EURY